MDTRSISTALMNPQTFEIYGFIPDCQIVLSFSSLFSKDITRRDEIEKRYFQHIFDRVTDLSLDNFRYYKKSATDLSHFFKSEHEALVEGTKRYPHSRSISLFMLSFSEAEIDEILKKQIVDFEEKHMLSVRIYPYNTYFTYILLNPWVIRNFTTHKKKFIKHPLTNVSLQTVLQGSQTLPAQDITIWKDKTTASTASATSQLAAQEPFQGTRFYSYGKTNDSKLDIKTIKVVTQEVDPSVFIWDRLLPAIKPESEYFDSEEKAFAAAKERHPKTSFMICELKQPNMVDDKGMVATTTAKHVQELKGYWHRDQDDKLVDLFLLFGEKAVDPVKTVFGPQDKTTAANHKKVIQDTLKTIRKEYIDCLKKCTDEKAKTSALTKKMENLYNQNRQKCST